MSPGALPAVLRYSVEVDSRGADGRPLIDVRECEGWLELQGAPRTSQREPVPPADLNGSELQLARFWRAEPVAPRAGDVITIFTRSSRPLVRLLVLMTVADHLVVGIHEQPASVPNPGGAPCHLT
jgi:hypothetical protein